MIVKFYSKPKQNAARTAEEGRPMFDDVEMCEYVTNDRNFNPHFLAHEEIVTYDARSAGD